MTDQISNESTIRRTLFDGVPFEDLPSADLESFARQNPGTCFGAMARNILRERAERAHHPECPVHRPDDGDTPHRSFEALPFTPPTPTAPDAASIAPDARWFDVWDALVAHHLFPSPLCRRVLLYGRPGTGKSGAPWYSFNGAPVVERITLHSGSCAEDLTGSWTLRAHDGGTDSVWVDGCGTRAMRASAERVSILCIDEIDKAGPDVETSMHQLADDPDMARIILPDGSTVTPHGGFGIVATMNGSPDDLSDALRDRFDVLLNCDIPSPGVLSGCHPNMAALVLRTCAESPAVTWRPALTARTGRAWSKLADVVGDSNAASIIFGPAAPDVLTMLATVSV
jgi:hypothetical protein